MVEHTEVQAEFKETEIGKIPANWEVKEIQEVARITTGAKNTQDRIDDGAYPFFVRSQTIERINSYSFDGEAVLTAGDGVGTGKVFHYINGKFDFHQRVYKMSDFSEELNGYYFYIFFSSNFYNRMMQMTAKSSVDSVRREMIAKMLIPLPTLAEQTAIATALNDADALITQLENLIAKKRAIKQGAMQELLKPKEGWEVKTITDICTLSRNRIDPISSNEEFRSIELEHISQETGRLLGYANSKNLRSQKTIFKEGDVLFGKLRPYLKKFLYPNFDGVCSTEIWVLQSKSNIFGKYLFYVVQSNNFLEAANLSEGTKMPRADWKKVKEVIVHLPDSITEQTRIAQTLSDMDAEIETLEKKLAKYQQVKQGMMQNLLTGKIRLI